MAIRHSRNGGFGRSLEDPESLALTHSRAHLLPFHSVDEFNQF